MGEFVDGCFYSKNLNSNSLSKMGKLNVGLDHLSRIDTREEPTGVKDDLLDAHVFQIEAVLAELEEIAQFLEVGKSLEGMSMKKKQILSMKSVPYSLINGFLYKMGLDDILRRCVLEHERDNIMYEAHYGLMGGHFQVDTTAKKTNSQGYGSRHYTKIAKSW